MNFVYIINGESGVGKDTFVEYIKKHLGRILYRGGCEFVNFHRSDLAKKSLLRLGWNGERTEKSRALLKHMVDFMEDEGLLDLSELVKDTLYPRVTFLHIRDPKKIEELRKHINDDKRCTTTLITRQGFKSQEEDIWGIADYDYDIEFQMFEGLESIESAAEDFAEWIAFQLYNNENWGMKHGKSSNK